jgi:hypothetical protein
VWDTSKNLPRAVRSVKRGSGQQQVFFAERIDMGYREAREIARIRHELRERLMAQRADGTGDVLARFRHVAEDGAVSSPELRSEYERWRLRFELLGPA